MIVKSLLALVTLLYPIIVYFGLQNVGAKQLILVLVVVAGLRLVSLGKTPLNHWWLLVAVVFLALFTWMSGNALGLKLYPVMMNIGMLILFGSSLFADQTIIERLARLQEPDLPEAAIRYTRNVTKIWCVFFIINGLVALATALWANNTTWALYNGLIAYIAMGLLFGIEWLIRQRVKAQNNSAA